MNKEEEREIIQLDAETMWRLKTELGIKKYKCHYCKEHIKKGDKFSMFNKPIRLVCNSVLCMAEAVQEDEDV